jgi:ribokinase
VKLGSEGALGVGPGGELVRVEAPAAGPIVDTTGAGDSFDAGFLAAWLGGATLPEALRFAVACGTLSVRAAAGTDGQATREEAARLAG